MKNRTFKRIALMLAACALLTIALCGAKKGKAENEKAKDDGWIQIFNGKDMTGWTPKFKGYELGVNYNDTFRVEDGILKASYDKWESFKGEFGHLFYKDTFSHYILRAEYRFVGEQVKGGPGWATRNNGLMIHGQKAETMGKDQDFPVSIEVQLLGGLGKGNRSTGNLCTPGTNVVIDDKLVTKHVINSNSKTFNGDQWVTIEVEVVGGEVIRHKVNGEQVMEYFKPQYDPRDGGAKKLMKGDDVTLSEGTISIQAESHGCEFRKIEVKPIKK